MATPAPTQGFPIRGNDRLNLQSRNTYGQLRDYSALQTLPNAPVGHDQAAPFDWHSATPTSGQRTPGLIPATSFGGLQDSRYLPDYAIPTGTGAGSTVNHLDAEMARGVPDAKRYADYDRLRTQQDNIGANIDRLDQRSATATANGRAVPKAVTQRLGEKTPVRDYLAEQLAQFLQTQQAPTPNKQYFNSIRESELSRQNNKRFGG